MSKFTRNVVWKLIIAFVVVTLALALYGCAARVSSSTDRKPKPSDWCYERWVPRVGMFYCCDDPLTDVTSCKPQ